MEKNEKNGWFTQQNKGEKGKTALDSSAVFEKREIYLEKRKEAELFMTSV